MRPALLALATTFVLTSAFALAQQPRREPDPRSMGGGDCRDNPYNCKDTPNPLPPAATVWLEEMTWMDVRDALAAGKTTAIVPTGGIKPNGPWLVLGKHNYVLRTNCDVIARKLGNALCAPILPLVPEGRIEPPGGHMRSPGTISLREETFQAVLEDVVRSLRAHGFRSVILIGDSGGNQPGMTAVAKALNEEWKDAGTKVFALTDYYEEGRVHYRAWMEAQFGYEDALIGSHAGISDTSQMLYVYPAGIRADRILPWGGPADSGVTGNPALSTADIGRMGIAYKVNAGINQYKLIKNPPPQRGGGRPPAQ